MIDAYFENPDRDRAAAFDADGWFRTGDIAKIDDRTASYADHRPQPRT